MQKNINGILMRTVALLLMLVFLSTAMVTGRYARYTSSASGEDSARVAKFDVTVTDNELNQFFSVAIDPSNTATAEGDKVIKKTITVSNQSEVAVLVDIDVTNKYQNLPIAFQFPVSCELAPGSANEIPLQIYWNGDADDKYIGMVDLLEITVQVVQVD